MNTGSSKQKTLFSCPHSDACPGCRVETVEPSAVTELRHFFLPWNLSVSYQKGPETGWRSRAKLAVRRKKQGCTIGLFQEGTHDVIDISRCQMHTQALNQALDILLQKLVMEKNTHFYDEKTHTGVLRYLLLSEETHSGKVSVVFVLNLTEVSQETLYWITLSKTLIQNKPNLFHSFWINFQTDASNTIVGKQCQHVAGALWQWELIRNVWMPFHPLHFRQANLPMFTALLEDLEKNIPNQTHIVDLFGGMGAIGLSLCHKAQHVECVEIDPTAESSFNEAQKRLSPSLQSHISFHCLSCNSQAIETILRDAETVLVDPPRKGLSLSLINALSQSPASTLAYISCCAETLLKNLHILIEKGWKPAFVKTYQFFPKTDHIESLVVLRK